MHLCPYPVRSQDFAGLLLFGMCLRQQNANREHLGHSSFVFGLLGWDGQPQCAALGRRTYQEGGHRVPSKAIYLSPTSGSESLFTGAGGGVLEQAGSSHFERCSDQKGQHNVMGKRAFL